MEYLNCICNERVKLLSCRFFGKRILKWRWKSFDFKIYFNKKLIKIIIINDINDEM